MESTPALLRWFLEQKQAVFPGSCVPWTLITQYLALSSAKRERTSAGVVLVSSIMTIGREYQQALLQSAGGRHLSKDVAKLLGTIVRCHGTACRSMFDSSSAVPCHEGPAMQQLLLSPALAQVVLLQLAGACQQVHQQHQKGQQQFQTQMATPGGSSSSSSRVGVNTSTSSSRRVGINTTNSSSSSSKPGPLHSLSFAELVVPPDHDLVAAALGKEAVALYAGEAKPAPTDSPDAEVVSPLGILQSSIHPLVQVCSATLKVAAAAGGALDEKMPVSTMVWLQVLLEACVLCGELALKNSCLHYTVRYVLRMLGPLLSCVSRAEWESLLEARGPFLLEALSTFLSAFEEAQQQQQLDKVKQQLDKQRQQQQLDKQQQQQQQLDKLKQLKKQHQQLDKQHQQLDKQQQQLDKQQQQQQLDNLKQQLDNLKQLHKQQQQLDKQQEQLLDKLKQLDKQQQQQQLDKQLAERAGVDEKDFMFLMSCAPGMLQDCLKRDVNRQVSGHA